MRKTAVLTATTVLVLAGGSTAYAFAVGSDDGAAHDRAAVTSAAASFVRAHGHMLAVAAGDDHRSRHSEPGDDRGGETGTEPGDDRGGETRHASRVTTVAARPATSSRVTTVAAAARRSPGTTAVAVSRVRRRPWRRDPARGAG